MRMVDKGLGEGGWQKGGGLRGWLARGLGKVVGKRVGVYEYGWQGALGRWFAKGWEFMMMVGKGLREGGLQ
jgi:hypothetical protein